MTSPTPVNIDVKIIDAATASMQRIENTLSGSLGRIGQNFAKFGRTAIAGVGGLEILDKMKENILGAYEEMDAPEKLAPFLDGNKKMAEEIFNDIDNIATSVSDIHIKPEQVNDLGMAMAQLGVYSGKALKSMTSLASMTNKPAETMERLTTAMASLGVNPTMGIRGIEEALRIKDIDFSKVLGKPTKQLTKNDIGLVIAAINKLATDKGMQNAAFATNNLTESMTSLKNEISDFAGDLPKPILGLQGFDGVVISLTDKIKKLQNMLTDSKGHFTTFGDAAGVAYAALASLAAIAAGGAIWNIMVWATAAPIKMFAAAYSFLFAGKAMKIYAAATKIAAFAQMFLNAAVDGNPIGLVISLAIIAVIGLITAVYYLIKNWQTVKDLIIDVWHKLTKGFSDAMKTAKLLADYVKANLLAPLGKFAHLFGKAIDYVGLGGTVMDDQRMQAQGMRPGMLTAQASQTINRNTTNKSMVTVTLDKGLKAKSATGSFTLNNGKNHVFQ